MGIVVNGGDYGGKRTGSAHAGFKLGISPAADRAERTHSASQVELSSSPTA